MQLVTMLGLSQLDMWRLLRGLTVWASQTAPWPHLGGVGHASASRPWRTPGAFHRRTTRVPCLPQQLPQGWGAQHPHSALLAGWPRTSCWTMGLGEGHRITVCRGGHASNALQPPSHLCLPGARSHGKGSLPLEAFRRLLPAHPSVHRAAMGHARSLRLAHSCKALLGSAGLRPAGRSSPHPGRRRKRRKRRRQLCR